MEIDNKLMEFGRVWQGYLRKTVGSSRDKILANKVKTL